MATGRGEPLCLHVFIMSSQNLMKKDLFGMCDPYVKVTLRRDKKSKSKITKTRHKTRNPEWNEKLEYSDINLEKDIILFEVFDNNRLTRDNFLGRVIIKLSSYPIDRQKVDISQHGRPHSFDLRGRSAKSRVSGTLKLKLLFYNTPSSNGGGETGPPLPPRSRGMSQQMSVVSPNRPHSASISQLVPGSQGAPTSSVRPVTSSNNGLTRQTTMAGDEWTMEDNEDEEEPIPPGWEQRVDANGRTFYVDHANRQTSWQRPVLGAAMRDMTERVRIERDRRFQQTMRRRIPTSDNDGSATPVLSPDRGVSSSSPSLTVGPRPRPDSSIPVSSRPVSAMDTSLRSISPSLNDLPPGWEKRVATNGRPFYVDHSTRTTHWVHPRQRSNSVSTTPTAPPTSGTPGDIPPPLPPPRGSRPSGPRERGTGPQTQQATPPRQSMVSPTPQVTPTQVTPTQPQTTPTIATPPQSTQPKDLGPLPPGWEMRIVDGGRQFFIDHSTHSTQWEDPRIVKTPKQAELVYDRNYKAKYEAFQKKLLTSKPADLPRQVEIPVRRSNLFEDSHRKIMGIKNKDHLKARLYIKFPNETGLDYGGLSREWFFLLSHEIFSPYYGLFEYSASDNYTLQVNPDSGFCNEHHLDYFRFIGRIFALAIYHKKLIDAFFVRPFYKIILGRAIKLDDMESVDTEFYNSIKYILENDPEPLCLTFTASREFLGQVEEVELKPNGGDIDVVEDNKKEYIKLLMKWRFEDRCAKQMEAIKKGFNDIIPLSYMKLFDERELEYLLCGLGEINVDDWKKNSIYQNGYTASDHSVVWFWKAVENMDNEGRARLLQFVTGTSRVPMNGFAELHGSNGLQRFCIKKLGNPDALPRSHTCFNRIDLPPYRSYHELKEKMKLAIENTEGFEGVD